MPEYCPLEKCDWQSGYDRICRWPTYNCPWKDKRERALIRQREIERQIEEARRKKRKKVSTNIPGIYQRKKGRWVAYITVGHNGIERYHLGTYDTPEEAEAIRKEAEDHRERGDLKEWVEKGRE